MRLLFYLLAVLLALSGCADSSTTGDITERDYDQKITINNSSTGDVNVYFPVTGASDTDTETKQDTKNSSVISPESSASLSPKKETATSVVGEIAKADPSA
jgi:hypothetical protein